MDAKIVQKKKILPKKNLPIKKKLRTRLKLIYWYTTLWEQINSLQNREEFLWLYFNWWWLYKQKEDIIHKPLPPVHLLVNTQNKLIKHLANKVLVCSEAFYWHLLTH